MNRNVQLFCFLLASSLSSALLAAEAPGKQPVALPVDFTENRFFVIPVTAKGEKLRLYTDSGGGLFLLAAPVKRLGLPTKSVEEDGQKMETVALPAFRPEASIPSPLDNEGRLPVFSEGQMKGGLPEAMDGILGQDWLAGRVWTWDYPGRRLLWLPEGGLPAVDPSHRVTLGFQTDKTGKRSASFPRIQATIDGETLDLLLDTGATVALSPEALAQLADHGPKMRGTSFIAAVHFDAWHRTHPDWRVIEKADLTVKGEPMIEVPAVTVAGYTVGPVWFTRRPDSNFHQFMSQYMDRQVEGALGGSALRFFRVTVDYPRAIAVFERP
ncbi:MAG TPA: hypothetical protein VIE43_16910 [Thermoanaerobaculia bacterium]|jgi:hypothetical protein|nr:hypothetical protein [Thermoanaerobaculia bacterium]